MLEHLKAQIGDKDTKDMTADELQFYYFNYGSQKLISFFITGVLLEATLRVKEGLFLQ